MQSRHLGIQSNQVLTIINDVISQRQPLGAGRLRGKHAARLVLGDLVASHHALDLKSFRHIHHQDTVRHIGHPRFHQ